MARLDPDSASLKLDSSLRDAVVVLSGGSRGIGLATVSLLASRGAKVVFGDIHEPASVPANSSFLLTDVSRYADVVALFKYALKLHGRVDHAVSNAAIMERPGWFEPGLGVAGVEACPDMAVEEINLRGALWFAHVAVQFLAHGVEKGQEENKSLTLMSSLAGFKETPGLFVYQAAKHGVIGIMRSLRMYLPKQFGVNIRVNTICPSATDTGMIAGIKESFAGKDTAKINSPEEVAKVVVAVCAAGKGSQSVWYDGHDGQGTRRRQNRGGMDWDDDEREARGMSGRSWVVIAGEAWDIEEGLDRTEDLWLGLSSSDLVWRNQKALGVGENWHASGGAKGLDRELDVEGSNAPPSRGA
jgi:NAD(P)-dependent dehydrogenase (short-subunit alcohol dehydrogenase family)